MKERLKDTRGAMTIVEATFVFPITFFIVLIMIMAGEASYQHARVEFLVTSWAVNGAARVENPMMKELSTGGVPTNASIPEVMPYRYILTGEAKTICGTVEADLEEAVKKQKPLIFPKMSPDKVNVTVEAKMNPLVSSIPIVCEFEIPLPIKMIFTNQQLSFKYKIGMTATVGDPSEFVRNVAMIIDVSERNQAIMEFAAKVKDGMMKVGAYIN